MIEHLAAYDEEQGLLWPQPHPWLFCLPIKYNCVMIGETNRKGWITMIRRCANLAFSYAVIAILFGVFYREFTKFSHFTGQTNLAFLHTHYFLLGMFFFLLLMLVEKAFPFSDGKTGKLLIVYQVGLNVTGLGFLLRGLTQVLGTELNRGLDAAISGIAGIGHILMGGCILLLLLNIRKKAA